MGGLRKKMPITFWTFTIGGLALAGFPLITAGFWSKDEIFAEAFHHQPIVFIILALSALLTAFYTMRQISLTFLGKSRSKAADHAHETPWTMTAPLVILGFFAVAVGWVGIPEEFPIIGGIVPNWFHEFVGGTLTVHPETIPFHPVPLITSLVVSLGGLYLGWYIYRNVTDERCDPLQRPLGKIYVILKNKYYFDEFYQKAFIQPSIQFSEKIVYAFMDKTVIDGALHWIARVTISIGSFFRNSIDKPIVNGFGDLVGDVTQKLGFIFKPIQTGKIQQYMIMALVTLVAFIHLLLYFLLGYERPATE